MSQIPITVFCLLPSDKPGDTWRACLSLPGEKSSQGMDYDHITPVAHNFSPCGGDISSGPNLL